MRTLPLGILQITPMKTEAFLSKNGGASHRTEKQEVFEKTRSQALRKLTKRPRFILMRRISGLRSSPITQASKTDCLRSRKSIQSCVRCSAMTSADVFPSALIRNALPIVWLNRIQTSEKQRHERRCKSSMQRNEKRSCHLSRCHTIQNLRRRKQRKSPPRDGARV